MSNIKKIQTMKTQNNTISAEVVNAVKTVKCNTIPKFEDARVSESFENIVKNLCKKHGQANNPDWRQEFEIALWEATQKHTPERGEFWSYAYFVMSSTAIRLAAKDRLVTIGYDYVCGSHDKEVVRTSSCELTEFNSNIEDNSSDVVLKLSLNDALAKLTDVERYIVKVHSGMERGANGSESFDAIANDLSMSSAAARKTYQTAIAKMQSWMA